MTEQNLTNDSHEADGVAQDRHPVIEKFGTKHPPPPSKSRGKWIIQVHIDNLTLNNAVGDDRLLPSAATHRTASNISVVLILAYSFHYMKK